VWPKARGPPLPYDLYLGHGCVGAYVSKVAEDGMLQPLVRRVLPHQNSLYADDVVLFICPEEVDIAITMDILHLFGDASGFKTNLQKGNILPIRCEEQDLQIVQQQLPCALSDFPCKYLGLPLALKKLKKEHIEPIIDRLADLLPGWKADLLTRAGRKNSCSVHANSNNHISGHDFGSSSMGTQGN
jgi:hypothetical protein